MAIKNSVIDVLEHVITWRNAGHDVNLVTVVNTFGSSPRPVGTIAAVRHDGLLIGSVSGGCIEKQLVASFQQNNTKKTVSYRINDAEAKRYGLMCGGEIELVFEQVGDVSEFRQVAQRLQQGQRVQRRVNVNTGDSSLHDAATNDRFAWDGNLLVQVFGSSQRVIIIGAAELSRYTAQFAGAADFDVIVAEPRAEFRAAWPLDSPLPIDEMPDDAVKTYATHQQCAVLALTHDPNLDDLALLEALSLDIFYVGALGSNRSHKKRIQRLQQFDVDAERLANMHAPVGLTIGSRSSAEIAIAIVAQLIQCRAELFRAAATT